MPLWDAFVGPAYRARSQTIDAEALINLYLETTGSQGDVKKSALYGTPGSKFLLSVSTADCRGCFSEDTVTLITVGNELYSLDLVNTAATALGTIVDDGKPVSYASNGRGGEQIAICGGGQVKVLNLLTMVLSAAIALPLTNAPVMLEFIDGYFLLLEAATIRVWFSALEDGTTWDALDFFANSETSDNFVGLKRLRDKVWVFGSRMTTVYYDSGDATNPFVPYPGSVMDEGLVSPWAVGVQGETLIWMSQNKQGTRRVVTGQGYAPTRVSTPAIDFALVALPTVTDCEVLIYEQEGHAFACFTTSNQTWCYDALESVKRGEPIWHQRDTFDSSTATSSAWRARGCCTTSIGTIIGDRNTGGIYLLDLDTFCDAFGPMRRLRRATYLSGENQWMFLDQIELGMQAGVGLTSGQGSDPHVMASISRDGAFTWDPPIQASLGPMGAYQTTASWYACGRVRTDRFVLEVTQTDAVRCVWGPGLWLRATPGTGQL
jgi:hypothetical protein